MEHINLNKNYNKKNQIEQRLQKEDAFESIGGIGNTNVLEIMESMKSCIKYFLNEIHDEIEKNSYDYIVADDASARAITLLFGKTIQRIQKNRGKIPPKIEFLNPGLIEEGEYRKNSSEKDSSDNKNKKALIVTEIVSSGYSVNTITQFLHDHEINQVDVISQTGIDARRIARPEEKLKDDTKLYGIHKAFSLKPIPSFSMAFHSNKINGVVSRVSPAKAIRGEKGEIVRIVRDYIKISSQELAEEYLQEQL